MRLDLKVSQNARVLLQQSLSANLGERGGIPAPAAGGQGRYIDLLDRCIADFETGRVQTAAGRDAGWHGLRRRLKPVEIGYDFIGEAGNKPAAQVIPQEWRDARAENIARIVIERQEVAVAGH